MPKAIEINNPLSSVYHAFDETEKKQIKKKIMDAADISEPQFYYIIRYGRAKKLLRKVFAKHFGQPIEHLFPES